MGSTFASGEVQVKIKGEKGNVLSILFPVFYFRYNCKRDLFNVNSLINTC